MRSAHSFQLVLGLARRVLGRASGAAEAAFHFRHRLALCLGDSHLVGKPVPFGAQLRRAKIRIRLCHWRHVTPYGGGGPPLRGGMRAAIGEEG
jgi:hypothetical protein